MTDTAWRSVTATRRWAFAAVIGVAVALGACTALDRPTAPADQPATPEKPAQALLNGGGGGLLGTGLGAQLLQCTPLPEAHAAAVIGPDGGTLQVGPHALVVPPGALPDTLTITADAPSDTVNNIRFTPEGLQFAAGHPARLTMSYANCSLAGQLLPKRIAYTTDLLQILEILVSVDNVLLRRVSADIAHFSRYAIAW
jgi:hypothetical protein